MANEEVREMRLSELLTPKQLAAVIEFAKAGDKTGLRAYLRGISGELEAKGVVADYLYYMLWMDL